MSVRDNTSYSFCRIIGLTSTEGKKRNGSAARVKECEPTKRSSKDAANDTSRRPVCVDGFPGPLLIKVSNIELFPVVDNVPNVRDISVGVGRDTILNTTFRAALVENSRIVDEVMVTGGAARSKGNLELMEKFVRHHKQRTGHVLIKLTDLNVARAVNRVASGERNVRLAAPLNKTFQNVLKNFPVHSSKKGKQVLVKFESHRVHEDRLEVKEGKMGPQRFEAVKQGAYQIYPCACKEYLDALEVRYVDTKRKNAVINHEIYLDYGLEEAKAYPRNVAAMEEHYRLFPSVLSQVDPQAFWAAMLWLTPFVRTLEELELPTDLINDWKDLEAGKKQSSEYFERSKKKLCSIFVGTELSKGCDENWGIPRSKDKHLRIATDYAICAVEALQTAAYELAENMSSLKIHTLDYYIGTDLDKYIIGMSKFRELTREETASRGNISLESTARLFNKAMKSVGFGKDSKFRMHDQGKVCNNCGQTSKKKLLTCARCEGVSYCNTKCQKEHWKVHRNSCSRVYVQLQRQLEELDINLGEDGVKIRHCKPTSSLPTSPAMFSEVSGTGMMSIMWNPGQTSFIHINDGNTSDLLNNIDSVVSQMAKNVISFKEFSELHPTVRFLLCCGPLPQLEIAQEAISDALRLTGGRLDQLRVPNVGFTGLEWAAKKGNVAIVEWLCTDERTKGLIHVGCPVGWAGYTGQIEIMRSLVGYGADPGKTDAVLWGSTPPLMVAAQNGQLDAMKFFVNECKQDIGMIDRNGKDVLNHIKIPPNWREIPGHVACNKWAKKLIRNVESD